MVCEQRYRLQHHQIASECFQIFYEYIKGNATYLSLAVMVVFAMLMDFRSQMVGLLG